MDEQIPKKTGVILLLVVILLAILTTFGILNYVQPQAVGTVQPTYNDLSGSEGGSLSLNLVNPHKIYSKGASVSLVIGTKGG